MGATAPFLQSTGGKGLLAEEEERLFKLRQETEGAVRREIEAERVKLEEEGRASQVRAIWHAACLDRLHFVSGRGMKLPACVHHMSAPARRSSTMGLLCSPIHADGQTVRDALWH